MSARKGLDRRRPAIRAILLSTLLAIMVVAAGCGDQMARMQENQIRLQAMVAANARQLATLSSQVHVHQGETAEGLAKLEENLNATDAQVAAVRNEQAELRHTVAANDRDLKQKVAQLADNQASLRDGIAHVADIAQRTNATINTVARDQATLHQLVQQHSRDLADSLTAVASDVTSLAGEQTALHATVRSNTATLAEKIAVVQRNQSDVQSIISRLVDTADVTANDVAALATAQATIQQTQTSQHEALTGRLASLAQNQQSLRADLGSLHDKANVGHDRLVALASGQDAIQGTLRTNNEAVTAGLKNIENSHQNIHNGMHALRDGSDRLAADLATVASEQASLRQAFSEGHAQLVSIAEGQDAIHHAVGRLDGKTTALATDLADRQNLIRAGLDGLNEDTNRLGEKLEHVAAQQRTMEIQAQADNEVVVGRLASLAENQQNLQAGIHHVGEQTSQVAAGQAAMHETIQGQHNVYQERMTALADNQRMIQAGVNTMTATTNQGALTILTMANRQAEMEQSMQAGIAGLTAETRQLTSGQQNLNQAIRDRTESLNTQLAHLSQEQQQLRGGLDTLTATTSQVALDVLAIHDTQAGQGQVIAANQQQLVARLDATAQGQQQIGESLDTIAVTTTQTALDVLTVHESQAGQTRAMQNNQQQLVARLDATTQGQQQIGESLDTIAVTTAQTALDVLAVGETQSRQVQTAQGNQQQLMARLDAAAQDRQRIGEGLDTIAATTTQTALDVLTVHESQTAQTQAMQANQQQLVARLDVTAQDQQRIGESLDTIAAGATQVAREVATVGDNQTRLERAFETNRQELVSRLAQIAQGQQEWLTRFDTAQASIETMATGLASLEQRVASLQGTLQNSLSDLNTLLDASQQRRAQFEETLRSDVQFMGDSLVQLRQTQSNLENQLQKMHNSSESQTEDLLAAIEQLRRRAESDATTAPAQIRSSKAQPEEILLP